MASINGRAMCANKTVTYQRFLPSNATELIFSWASLHIRHNKRKLLKIVKGKKERKPTRKKKQILECVSMRACMPTHTDNIV